MLKRRGTRLATPAGSPPTNKINGLFGQHGLNAAIERKGVFPQVDSSDPPDPLELVHRFGGWARVPVEAWQQFDKRLKRWRRAQQ